jgi:TatD DNase family protein
MIDTHAHIYSEEFDTDRGLVIERARKAGVKKIILPNIDSTSLQAMLSLERDYPEFCYAAIGLHPTSVDEKYEQELKIVESELQQREYIAVGEIGIDLYWDKSFVKEQIIAFQKQVELAIEYNIPVIIHVRDSLKETLKALIPYKYDNLKGIFHSFGGSIDEAKEIFTYGDFYLGINGIVTFKNSKLSEVVKSIGLERIVLETDSPYLTPAPYRGKRNESSYLTIIAQKIAEVFEISYEAVIEQTTKNAFYIFNLNRNR